MSDTKTLLSYRAYAKHRGCSLSAVQKAIKAGRISTVKSGRKKLIDPQIADSEWDENTDVLKQPPAELSPDDESILGEEYSEENLKKASGQTLNKLFFKARARHEEYKSQIAKLKYREQQGELVRASDVEKAAFENGLQIKNLLLSLPDKLSAILASETDPHKVRQILEESICECLLEISNG